MSWRSFFKDRTAACKGLAQHASKTSRPSRRYYREESKRLDDELQKAKEGKEHDLKVYRYMRRRELLRFCNTLKQEEAVTLVYIEGLSKAAAARELGIDPKSLRERLEQVENRAAKFSDSDVYDEKPVMTRKPKAKRSDEGLRIMVIPDTQVKPGVNTDHIAAAARYALKMRPDVICHIGDHWDMPSLS